ncbi:Type IV secretory pathway, VirD4 component, TraG/TraD family ATPase [Parafrankia irregularis]|uniref:Type IV secretory pathway, VirD4 component, TraG/TraD family ATPase n=1 Tax=Parafrankia irregularis TaxID=795642 RepID=A0A0S4QQ17_9ACTN|nr:MULTISPECIES: type IV secretory system conjugative DNA transfer family protein [Parafrankia]MBE3200220.1 type IV secretory system conjugative DNA transfer family protein [Parafrankia sp. CH37]CUU56586.1 Type IV secretory pathway, VirD4 component, TraG/TraD family ATPase [Parafrankia irregularis]
MSPGPLGSWAATVLPLVVLALLCGLAALVMVRDRAGVADRRRLGIDPEARLARPADLAALWVGAPRRGRMIIGRVGSPRGRLVATEDSHSPLDPAVPGWLVRRAQRRRGPRGSVIVLGPSQCGKTAALAIPAILEWDGPLIALSVKNDLLGATIARRRQLGDVAVFDPAGATGELGASWSPLGAARTLAGARRAARSIANATSWTSTSSGDMSFWTSAAEDLLGQLFWTAATVDLGMDTVVGWVVRMDRDTVRGLLNPLASHRDQAIATDGAQVFAGFEGIWANDRKQVSSTYLVARQMIQPWQEPRIAASAAVSQIDLDWLLDRGPDGRAANTLYLSADLDDAERLAPVLGGLLDDLMRQAYSHVGHTGTPLDPPLLVVVDEAGNWPMRNLPGRISTCAGIGIQLLLIYQSKAQIDAAYGPKADVVISNAVTKVFFAGLSDRSTLDYAAGLLGQEHILQTSTSVDSTGLGGPAGRRGVSRSPTRVELLPSALLRQVAPGQALLVHNTLPPAHLFGRYWYLDEDLHALATGRRLSHGDLARQAAARGRISTDDRDTPPGFPTARAGQGTTFPTGDLAGEAPWDVFREWSRPAAGLPPPPQQDRDPSGGRARRKRPRGHRRLW